MIIRMWIKRIVAIVLAIVCVGTGVLATPMDVKAANRVQGSAYLLAGKTIVITVFVKDGNKKVSSKQKKNDCLITEAAADFAMDIAYDYGKESNIITGNYSTNKDLIYEVTCKNPQNAKLDKSDTVRKEFKKNLYNEIKKKIPLNNLLKKYKTDSYIYRIVLPSMKFRAYMSSIGEAYYDEAIFTTTESNAGTVAHEMLHCFGAIDLYYSESDGHSQARKNLAEKLEKKYKGISFVMKGGEWTNDPRLVRATISDINLYFLGLSKDKKTLQKKYPMIKFPDVPGVGVGV